MGPFANANSESCKVFNQQMIVETYKMVPARFVVMVVAIVYVL